MRDDFFKSFGLEGKDIWVIGAAGYLGQSVVGLLHDAGAKVLCIDIENRADLFINSLKENADLTAASLNTRDTEQSKKFIEQHLAMRGAPHGLVDLSFSSTSRNFDDLTAEEFDANNHGGITSTFIFCREVGNAMKIKKAGSIVLFSSMYGSVSPDPRVYEAPMNVNPLEYGVSKAGIIQMMRYMAVHYGKDNMRVNCISPGPFPNPGVQEKHPDFIPKLAHKVPMGRVGKQHEIAGPVLFLLSDAASFITGHNLFVDGGWTSW